MDDFQLGAIGSSFGGMVIAASANPNLTAIALVATPFSLDFDLGEDADILERKLLVCSERVPDIRGLSSELFLSNPLVYARDRGYTDL